MEVTMHRAISSQAVSTMPTTKAAVVTLSKTPSRRHPSATRFTCTKSWNTQIRKRRMPRSKQAREWVCNTLIRELRTSTPCISQIITAQWHRSKVDEKVKSVSTIWWLILEEVITLLAAAMSICFTTFPTNSSSMILYTWWTSRKEGH